MLYQLSNEPSRKILPINLWLSPFCMARNPRNSLRRTQALDASYTVLQHSITSAAGEAISNLAARFAAGSDELAQLVRKDQDLTAEAERLDKIIIAAVSKPPAERNLAAEDQIRKHIEEIKVERDELQDIFNQRFPDYVALSKPQPLTIEQTQVLLADDEALITIDLGQESYVWVITKDRAEWKELSVSAEDVSKEVETLRTGLNPDSPKPFDRKLAYQLYQQVLGPIEEIISQKDAVVLCARWGTNQSASTGADHDRSRWKGPQFSRLACS